MTDHRCIPDKPCALCGRGSLRRKKPAAVRTSAPARKELPACSHLQTSPVRVAGSARVWQRCTGGYGSSTKGAEGLVCRCGTPGQGIARIGFECGPKCPGFTAAADPDRPQWRPAPPPDVRPTRPRLVITVAVGEEGERTHALTRASQERYAERVGADYVVLSDRTQDWFMLEKFRYGEWVKHYPGGTLCIDADVWVSRSAPDLFALVPPDQIGVSIADDLGPHGLLPDFARKLADVCRSQGVPVPAGADQTHWNSGLVVLRPEHAGYWTPPVKPIPKHWISEELWSKANTFRAGWKLFDLPHPAIHWQHWRDQRWECLGPPFPPFVHPAGLTQQPNGLQRRLDLLRTMEASGQ